MKYKDILQFNPITDVIQFDKLSDRDYQLDVLRNFVFPDYFLETIIPEFVQNMAFGRRNQKGMQIVGSYGTGKSHLMAMVQLVAEDANNLKEIRNDRARQLLEPIAGKFLVHRFELQHNNSLWNIVKYEITNFLESHGVHYEFDHDNLKAYGLQISEAMAALEEKYPDKGFILAIDEMLSFLRQRAEANQLDSELPVLQALGQACENSKFVFMYGVQELVYSVRKFQLMAQLLLKVKDRFEDLTIRKEDVAFVVQQRLLHKTDAQRALIKQHLLPFTKYYADMHGNIDKYVELFPVHPSYIDNFEKITIGKAQREILKTLSNRFEKIQDQEIPTNEPGLITYDQYFEQMMATPALQTNAEFKLASDTVKLVHDKIENNFEGARRKQIPLAKRIANACGIKLLQAPLNKQNGATPETLTDDLCCTFSNMEDRDFLIMQVRNCAQLIAKATSGMYFGEKDNGEFALRTEGGINIDQLIKDGADDMFPVMKDKSFAQFMVKMLGIENDPYRTGFDIYAHELPWNSHRITREGYIFFGGPNEKSTTHPRQHFYMIFMPIFRTDVKRGYESDEVYFVMDKLSDEFKNLVCLYGAAIELYKSAPKEQQPLYKDKMDTIFGKAQREFNSCYLDCTRVYYNGNEPKVMKSYSLPNHGTPLLDIFNYVASNVLEEAFSIESPDYPAFVSARMVISNGNRERFIQNAISKTIKPEESIPDGEAILNGLKILVNGQWDAENSQYAMALIDLLEKKGEGMVLNRDEILYVVPNSDNKIWRNRDFHFEADLNFVMIAALIQLGMLELTLMDNSIVNASNMDKLKKLDKDGYYNFKLVRKPKGINIPLIKAITKAFYGMDLSNKLDQESTYDTIVHKSEELAGEMAVFLGRTLPMLRTLKMGGEPVFDEHQLDRFKREGEALKGFYELMKQKTNQAKLQNLNVTLEKVEGFKALKDEIEKAQKLGRVAKRMDDLISYLVQAKQYVPAESSLMRTIDDALQVALGFNLLTTSDNEVAQMEEALRKAKEDYRNYYLTRYRSVTLNEFQQQKRTNVLNSTEYKVCNELMECSILNPSLFASWQTDLRRLKIPSVTVEEDLKRYPSPIANFNPLSTTKADKNIEELSEELSAIYESWVESIKSFLKSDSAKHSLSLLSNADRSFAARITSDMEPISSANSAKAVVEFVKKVGQELTEIPITTEMLNREFSHAMTADELQTRFDRLVTNLLKGKDRGKVRFIFRNETVTDE